MVDVSISKGIAEGMHRHLIIFTPPRTRSESPAEDRIQRFQVKEKENGAVRDRVSYLSMVIVWLPIGPPGRSGNAPSVVEAVAVKILRMTQGGRNINGLCRKNFENGSTLIWLMQWSCQGAKM
ncbi:hypothetical protein Salat_0151400 [Sesamum alatum]|uniref:Uncharacterized protein n=1 Tax=Sesamum alatum TaxID=300844 RepID=A0AAE1YY10_9LAMI|nr:hypothetical protein Salat_0151400 [Sesamum alatum]